MIVTIVQQKELPVLYEQVRRCELYYGETRIVRYAGDTEKSFQDAVINNINLSEHNLVLRFGVFPYEFCADQFLRYEAHHNSQWYNLPPGLPPGIKTLTGHKMFSTRNWNLRCPLLTHWGMTKSQGFISLNCFQPEQAELITDIVDFDNTDQYMAPEWELTEGVGYHFESMVSILGVKTCDSCFLRKYLMNHQGANIVEALVEDHVEAIKSKSKILKLVGFGIKSVIIKACNDVRKIALKRAQDEGRDNIKPAAATVSG